MNILVSNKIENINKENLIAKTSAFSKVEIDLGTGDATYVVKSALQNADTFYIGIEPAISQLKKAVRDLNRKKLENTLLVIGSVENLPEELENLADVVVINFPWGTLLKAVLVNLKDIAKLIKKGGKLQIVFGYDKELEPSETKRLELPNIDDEFINVKVKKKIEEAGLVVKSIEKISASKVKQIESSWAKKLSYNNTRPFHLIVAERAS